MPLSGVFVEKFLPTGMMPNSSSLQLTQHMLVTPFRYTFMILDSELYKEQLHVLHYASHLAQLLHIRTRKAGKVKALMPVGYSPSISICMVVSKSSVAYG